ncbi:LysE family translocator [Vibrio mexicanus]|uniref:LysE family translocator n=1 Tax=Vibrio mexicanus TaxID=1004326 RepID=UPI00063BFB32|nr:LysE family translocator [Vibrio mexicanus]
MTIESSIALFIAIALSAAIPGPSVLAVVSRTLSAGWIQGLLVVIGVLIADYVFIVLAITGLAFIANLMGDLAGIIKYLGVVYLFWLAYRTWCQPAVTSDITEVKSKAASHASLLTGFIMTLSNPKAILFYMGFFPAFINLQAITVQQSFIVIAISTLAVGGVLSLYALFATKSRRYFVNSQSKHWLNKICGGAFASCGTFLLLRDS